MVELPFSLQSLYNTLLPLLHGCLLYLTPRALGAELRPKKQPPTPNCQPCTVCATAFAAGVSRLQEESRWSGTFVQLQGVPLSHAAVVYQRRPRDPCTPAVAGRR